MYTKKIFSIFFLLLIISIPLNNPITNYSLNSFPLASNAKHSLTEVKFAKFYGKETNETRYLETEISPRIVQPGSPVLNVTMSNYDNISHTFEVYLLSPVPYVKFVRGEAQLTGETENNLTIYKLPTTELGEGESRTFLLNISAIPLNGTLSTSYTIKIRLLIDGNLIEEREEKFLVYNSSNVVRPFFTDVGYENFNVRMASNFTLFEEKATLYAKIINEKNKTSTYQISIIDYTNGLLQFYYHNQQLNGTKTNLGLLYMIPSNAGIELAPKEMMEFAVKIEPLNISSINFIRSLSNVGLHVDGELKSIKDLFFDAGIQIREIGISRIEALTDGLHVNVTFQLVDSSGEPAPASTVIGAIQFNGHQLSK